MPKSRKKSRTHPSRDTDKFFGLKRTELRCLEEVRDQIFGAFNTAANWARSGRRDEAIELCQEACKAVTRVASKYTKLEPDLLALTDPRLPGLEINPDGGQRHPWHQSTERSDTATAATSGSTAQSRKKDLKTADAGSSRLAPDAARQPSALAQLIRQARHSDLLAGGGNRLSHLLRRWEKHRELADPRKMAMVALGSQLTLVLEMEPPKATATYDGGALDEEWRKQFRRIAAKGAYALRDIRHVLRENFAEYTKNYSIEIVIVFSSIEIPTELKRGLFGHYPLGDNVTNLDILPADDALSLLSREQHPWLREGAQRYQQAGALSMVRHLFIDFDRSDLGEA